MARRSIHPPARVPLSDSEAEQARLLAHLAIRLVVRRGAAELLEIGADPDDLRNLRISTTTSLCGHLVAMARWGVASAEGCRRAQERVRQAGLVDSALYLAVLYTVHRTAPPPLYFGGGSGLDAPPGSGLAFPSGSSIDPTIRVRRYPSAVQEELWDLDDVPWTELARLRNLYLGIPLSGPG